MDSSESSDAGPEDESDLSARVETLERALAEQADSLRELRAAVHRLRSAIDAPSDADEVEPDAASPAPEETDRPERDAAPETNDTDEANSDSDGQPARSPSDEPPSVPNDRPETAHRPPESGTPLSAGADEAEGTASAVPSDESTSSSSSSESEALLNRLVSWAGLRSEDWLNYVGIGLFLFGVIFLLKYSIEQGWLVPVVRVGMGAVLGLVLLRTGLRLPPTRRRLRQVLLGGSSGTFYATIFAAYQFYGLISYPNAFTSMVLVTVGTVALGVRQDEPILSIIGVLGGLGTPFLLYTQTGGLAGVSLYTCTVLLGACAVFVWRGWRSLLYTTVAGGWTVFVAAVLRTARAESLPADAWALQAGIGIAWLLLAGTPVLQAFLHHRAPDRWPVVSLPNWTRPLAGTDRPAYGLVTLSPFIAFACTRLLWSASDVTWALVAGAGALIYSGAYAGLRRVSLSNYAPVHALVAAVMAAFGLGKVLGGTALLIAWGVEAVLLMALANRLDEPLFRVSGHGLFVVVTAFLSFRLLNRLDGAHAGVPFVRDALSNLVAIACVGGASAFLPSRRNRWVYRGVALAGWLAWLPSTLLVLPHGGAYTLVAWALTGVGLAWTAPSLQEDSSPPRSAAHLIYGILGATLAVRFVEMEPSGLPILNVPALSELLVLGLAVAVSRLVERVPVRQLYRGAALVGWLAWTVSEMASLPNGQAYISLLWGTTAAALLLSGARYHRRGWQIGGLATLAVFVGKLFFVDLASLPPLWRIALFLGFGAAFLSVSYVLPTLIPASAESSG